MVNLGPKTNVRTGDTVTLIGEGITAEEVAESCGTISYEVVCNINKGIKRVYKG
jgi:alanine racemase